MTALVIGGSGFIGRPLIERLLAHGDRVRATTRSSAGKANTSNLEWHVLDLATFDKWPEVLEDISTVYHLGWSTVPASAEADPASDVTDNVVGSIRLLEALKTQPSTRLVFASSGGAVYGRDAQMPATEDCPPRPSSAHGLAKLMVEEYIRLYADTAGVDAVVLRIGNAFGPSQSAKLAFGAISTFCRRAAAGEVIEIFGDGKVVRDYIYADDVIDAFVCAGDHRKPPGTYNVGSGTGHSLINVIATIELLSGRSVTTKFKPGRSFDVPISVLDVTSARTNLGWVPKTSFKDGVARTLAAFVDDREQR